MGFFSKKGNTNPNSKEGFAFKKGIYGHEIITLNCQDCQKQFNAEMWSLLNVKEPPLNNPDYKIRILSGELFKATCPKCGIVKNLEYDRLYHDPDKKFMVQLTISNDGNEPALEKETKHFVESTFVDYILRVVTSGFDFIEKINILNLGLNDKVIEILKHKLTGSMPGKGSNEKRIYLTSNSNEDNLYFEYYSGLKFCGAFTILMEDYFKFCGKFSRDMLYEKKQIFEEIGSSWINSKEGTSLFNGLKD